MGNKKILLIEDNTQYRLLLEKILVREGFNVESFDMATKAINKILTIDYSPDLIITDLMMPKMDGLSFLRELKLFPRLEKTKVVVLSAKKSQKDIDRSYQLGCDLFLFKDIELDILLERIYGLILDQARHDDFFTVFGPKECFSLDDFQYGLDSVEFTTSNEIELGATLRLNTKKHRGEVFCQVREVIKVNGLFKVICEPYSFKEMGEK